VNYELLLSYNASIAHIINILCFFNKSNNILARAKKLNDFKGVFIKKSVDLLSNLYDYNKVSNGDLKMSKYKSFTQLIPSTQKNIVAFILKYLYINNMSDGVRS
jgi:hypothetical protein